MWELDAAGFLSFVCFRGLSEALCLMFSVEKLKLRLQPYSIPTVVFKSIRLSPVPGLVDVAKIDCLSC